MPMEWPRSSTYVPACYGAAASMDAATLARRLTEARRRWLNALEQNRMRCSANRGTATRRELLLGGEGAPF